MKVLEHFENDESGNRFGLAGVPSVLVCSHLTLASADQGKFREGLAYGLEAIHQAETGDHPYSLAFACWALGYLHLMTGEFSRGISLLERGRLLTTDSKLFLVNNTAGLGYAYARSGRLPEGISLLERAVSGSRFQFSRFLSAWLSDAYILANRFDDALEYAQRAVTLSRQGGQRPYEARALWVLARAMSHRNAPEDARRHFSEALALAEDLGLRPLIAHCYLGLGELERHTGDRECSEEHFATAERMYHDLSMRYWRQQAESQRHH